jgi:replicative DNA helicase
MRLAKEQQFLDTARADDRGNTSRTDNHPRLTDLRGSGGTEEIGDVVLMPHRGERHNAETHLRNDAERVCNRADGSDV